MEVIESFTNVDYTRNYAGTEPAEDLLVEACAVAGVGIRPRDAGLCAAPSSLTCLRGPR